VSAFTSAHGLLRHFGAAQQLRRFGRKADIKRQARPIDLVEIDQKATFGLSASEAGGVPFLSRSMVTKCYALDVG
jgi:hypothetical protein